MVFACLGVAFWWGSAFGQENRDALPPRLKENRVLPGQLMVAVRQAKSTIPANDPRLEQLSGAEEQFRTLYMAGKTGEARRLLYRALAVLTGHEWTARDEFWRSLLLRVDTPIADPARPLIARLSQIYPTTYNPSAALRLHAVLLSATGQPKQRLDKPVKELGSYDTIPADLIDQPFSFAAELSEIEDGAYLLGIDIFEGEGLLHRATTPIWLVRGVDAARDEVERRLRAIEGHESAKASIRYPFDFALRVNLGWVEAQQFDASAVRRSREMLAELAAGRDPVWRAVGDSKRCYWFAEAGEIMPYRLYVPRTYDGQRPFPLIVALHGMGGTEDAMMGGPNSLMLKLAQQRGYIVASPLGYRRDGGYGSMAEGISDPARARTSRLSEQDVMNVLRLVRAEYRIDDARIYLMGHSMGGGGTWRLGAKYPDIWAALAPISAGARGFDPSDLKAMRLIPVLVCHGDADPIAPVSAARTLVAGMKELGMTYEYFEQPGGTHAMVAPSLPRVFDFFDRQRRPAEPGTAVPKPATGAAD